MEVSKNCNFIFWQERKYHSSFLLPLCMRARYGDMGKKSLAIPSRWYSAKDQTNDLKNLK